MVKERYIKVNSNYDKTYLRNKILKIESFFHTNRGVYAKFTDKLLCFTDNEYILMPENWTPEHSFDLSKLIIW